MKTLVCCLLALFWSLPLHAEIYKIRDEQGRITYTDTPPKDQPHETVELAPINTQPAVEPQRNFRVTRDEEDEPPISYVIELASPEDQAHVPPGQRNLEVAVQVEPQLQPGHGIQFIMDGQPLASPGSAQSHVIEEIFRGTHTISAQIVNEQGQVLATTPAATVYVHRPSVRAPR